jgi:hypothetical protein
MRKSRILSVLATLLLAACGGGSDPEGSAFAPGATGSGGTGTGTGGGGSVAAAVVTATTSTATIPSDGSASATITAFVRDTSNTLIAGVPVTFTASSGGVSGSPAVTDSSGAATATLVTAGDSSLRTITVTARAGSLQGTVGVQVVASTTTTTVQMGNGSGGTFVAGAIGVSNANLSAGGSTSLTVSLVQTGGTLFTGSATIGFNSPCIAAGTAEIRVNGVAASTITTTTGAATVTYVARGCSGADTVTASSTIGSQSLSATGTVTVAAATIGSIAFVSATPTNIALRGTGDSSRPESSTVVFQVLDQANGPVANATVNFALNTAVGGVALTSASASSDSQGRVQTVVNAGTVATSVKVTATVATTAISTQSSQLTVTTGIPTAASFSLAVQCFNIEGWDLDGITTGVTARLGDRFQNPVPDGTAVTFTAEGGNIQSQCTTATTPTEGGVCTVNYRSSNPRPANGRVTLLAKAIGEESFTDANGNGAFDNGETFADQAEPYRDDSEDVAYQTGEDFIDFNVNGIRDPADTIFNGVLCNDTSGRCGAATTRSTGIGQQNKIILSGSNPVVTLPDGSSLPGSVNMAFSSARTFSYWIRDVNGNVMPGGTTVTVTASGGGLSVTQPSTFTVPCSTIAANSVFPGITAFSFGVTSGTTSGTGVVTLSVRTPSDRVTVYQISVSVP